MTSRAGRTKTPRAISRDSRPGFSLLELLLALAIIVLLAGVMVLASRALGGGRGLRGAADRFASALRLARAEASATGRRLRIDFDEETHAAVVLIENDPTGEPGKFTRYGACTWEDYLNDSRLHVEAVRLTGPDVDATAGGGDEENKLQAVTFYPDGSSDSAEIQLRPNNESDTERVTITIDGMNGTVTTEITSTPQPQDEPTDDEDI